MNMKILLFVILIVFCTAAVPDSDEGSDAPPYDCGWHRQDFETRIVSGRKANYGEFPWLAVLIYIHKSNGDFAGMKCGGFVIDRYHILTAAHCLDIGNYVLDGVWLGVRKISDADRIDYHIVQRFAIKNIYKHNDYNAATKINDIALIKLDRRIIYTEYVKAICLPQYKEELPRNGTMLTVAGWGQPSLYPIGAYSDHKLKVEVPIYSYDECTKRLNNAIRDDQLCAEGEDQKGACWGDGGVPLMEPRRKSHHQRIWYATGLVSANTGCGSIGPIIHTRVSSYIDWIEKKIHSS